LHVGIVSVTGRLGRVFTWPSQRGIVHWAIFGIAAPQGYWRFAKIHSRFGTSSINTAWHVKSLVGVGVLGWSFSSTFVRGKGNRTQHTHVTRVAVAFGFFCSFAIIHILRMVVARLADTLLICFAEDPETVRRDDPAIDATLEEQYGQ
jgi:hypothetical protein